jgi:amino-acid N-acetyltransferase
MDWRFRAANDNDWSAIADLLSSLNLPLDGAKDHLSNFLLAFEEDELVGVAGYEHYGADGLLRSVAVRKQGQGLGMELVRRTIELARRSGITQLALLTTTAENFFPRFGFTRVNRDELSPLIKNSQEFQDACPDTAIAMRLFVK